LIAAATQQSKITHRLKVRFRREFVTRNALRATYRGTVYSIEAVIPDPDSGRRYQTLLASTGVR
jgi:SPP1 family predicted phage head-tail adaptor